MNLDLDDLKEEAQLDSPLPLLPDPARCSFGSTIHNGKLYVVGGHINQTHHYSTDNITDIVDVFDFSTNSWETRLAPRPRATQGFFLAGYGNYLYAIGGLTHVDHGTPETSYGSTNEIHRYDIERNEWSYVTYLYRPRSSYSAGVVDGKVYLIGGWDGNPSAGPVGGYFLDYVEVFDLATEQVTKLATPMPQPLRRACGAVVFDKTIYVVGGIRNTVNPNDMMLKSVLCFTPQTSSWSWGVDLPYGTFAPGVGVTQSGAIYSFGGYTGIPNPENFTNEVLMLPRGGSSWVSQTPMQQELGFVDVVNLNRRFFGLLGGAGNPAQSGQQSRMFDVYEHVAEEDRHIDRELLSWPPRH